MGPCPHLIFRTYRHCKTKLGYVQKWSFEKMAQNKIYSAKSFPAFSPYIVTSLNSDQLYI